MFNYKSNLVAIILDESGMMAYDFKLHKDTLEIVKEYKVEDTDSFHFKNAILILDTKDVISQNVLSENANDALIEAFPAIRASEVYFDFQNVLQPVISIIRKSVLDEIIKKNNLNERFLSSLRLGKTLLTVHKKQNGLTHQQLAEYAIGLHIKGLENDTNYDDFTSELNHKLLNKRFFEITKWSAILIFLFGLLINFFYHESYRKELEEVRVSTQSYKNIDDKIENLEQSVNAKQSLVNSNNSDDINTLRSIHELMIKNDAIQLTEVNYQPLRSTLQVDQKVRLATNKVRIGGKTSDKRFLDQYIRSLKKHQITKELAVITVFESKKNVMFELLLELDEAR